MASTIKYNIKNLVSLFKNICDLKKVASDEFEIYEIDARVSYRYALCTESTYLNHKSNGLYLKRLFSTFEVRNLNFVNDGLFRFRDNKITEILVQSKIDSLKNILSKPKKIIFVKGRFNAEKISEIFKSISINNDPSDYIITFVDPSGSNWEQFYEFYLSEYFISKGYITDVQIPWPKGGTPDFAIYDHKFKSVLGGFLVGELNTLRYLADDDFNYFTSADTKYEKLSIVEVKTKNKTSQAKKYLKAKITSNIFEFFPEGLSVNEPLGLMYLNQNKLFSIEPNSVDDFTYSIEDKNWFNIYLKVHLLSNFSIDELCFLTQKKVVTKEEMIKLASELTFTDIVKKIKNGI